MAMDMGTGEMALDRQQGVMIPIRGGQRLVNQICAVPCWKSFYVCHHYQLDKFLQRL